MKSASTWYVLVYYILQSRTKLDDFGQTNRMGRGSLIISEILEKESYN